MSVSALELTFDVTDISLEYVRDNLIHRAARAVNTLRDERGYGTTYVGSPRSAWQVRIYQKNKSVVRIEFILRKSFLSKYGIQRLEDVVLLSRINIWRLLSVREFSRSKALLATAKLNNLVREIVLDSARFNRPRDTVLFILRRNRIKPTLVYRRTNLQKKLETMQHRLIW
jgi:hypothetical protein